MSDITSSTNGRVKHIKRLLNDRRFRLRESQFAVEGSRWMSEIVRAKTGPDLWLATESWIENNADLTEQVTAISQPPLTIEPNILKELADTNTPSGVLAVLPLPQLNWPKAPTFLLCLDQVRDPGNLGTLMRSAFAAGVEGLILGPGCVDPFNPKVVRSSMGTVLRLPVQQTDWADGARTADLLGQCSVYLADAAGKTAYTAVDWRQPAAAMIGGEAAGAGESAKAIVHEMISIPMAQAAESLNAGVAGSVILFEALRQKNVSA
ncbi:MAG: TrmH family RNA methyltransferase [Cellvibrionaceae bacterium]|jgi:TrmH family RNA methyltransferase